MTKAEALLGPYRKFIRAFPEKDVGAYIKITDWIKHRNKNAAFCEILDRYKDVEEFFVSRSILYELFEEKAYDEFVLFTAMWGYPKGMRGHNFSMMIENENLKGIIDDIKNFCVRGRKDNDDSKNLFDQLCKRKGIHIATVSKLLAFSGVKVDNKQCVILDSRMHTVCRESVFNVLFPKTSRVDKISKNAWSTYVDYIRELDSIARDLRVHPANLEVFLFNFGLAVPPKRKFFCR